MDDQIGPVQVNMGGIQVDAEDMLRKLKSSNQRSDSSNIKPAAESGGVGDGGVTGEVASPSPPSSASAAAAAGAVATPEREMKAQNEALNQFFTGLMKRGASGSPRNTPEGAKKGTPRKKDEDGGGGGGCLVLRSEGVGVLNTGGGVVRVGGVSIGFGLYGCR